MLKTRPFLKWAGNKYQILEHIKAVLPGGNRLIELYLKDRHLFVLLYQ